MKIKYRVEGISPLLMNNPAGMAAHSSALGTKTIPSAEEEAETGAYRLEDGTLYFPLLAFRKSIINAGKGRRIGKMGASSVISGTLFVPDGAPLEVPLFDPDNGDKPLMEYEVDTRRAVLQGKTAILRSRPRLDSWGCEIDFEFDDARIQEEVITDLFAIAGNGVGVGNYRPEKQGVFGRYRVSKI